MKVCLITAGIAVCGVFMQPLQTAFAQQEETDEAPQSVRKFNDVLTDLLNEFAYDLKTAQITGIKNVSVRKVAVGESIPRSYESYVESLVGERFRKYSSIRVLQCTSCRVKRTVVENGRLTVTTPINNPKELDQIATQMGIETWVDIALLYQETSMIVAFNIFDSKTKELIWTKVYNSENIYKKSANLEKTKDILEGGTDKDSVKKEDPKSKYVVSVTTGYYLIPNVKKPSNMMGGMLRVAEKFNLERSEVGGSVAMVVDPGVFVQNYDGVDGDPAASEEIQAGSSKQTIKPFKYGMAIFGNYYHNFITQPENFDALRYGAHIGLGGIFAKGYITFTGRTGMVLKLGRHFVGEIGLLYSAPTTLKIKDTFTYKTKGGIGADVTFGLLF